MWNPWRKPSPPPQTLVEVEMGQNDVLVILCDKALTTEQTARLSSILSSAMTRKGPQVIVLDSGMRPTVLRRPVVGD